MQFDTFYVLYMIYKMSLYKKLFLIRVIAEINWLDVGATKTISNPCHCRSELVRRGDNKLYLIRVIVEINWLGVAI